MANFYYNQNDQSWYSDAAYTTSADLYTITSGDAVIGDISGSGAWLYGKDLTGVDFSGVTNLTNTDFQQSNLSGADFSGVTTLTNVRFQDANLTGVDFSHITSFSNASFFRANLTNVILPNDISGVDFTGAILTGVSLSSITSMTGAKFNGCDLLGIDFGTLDMSGVEFYGTDLTGSDFSQNNGLGGVGNDPTGGGSYRATNLSQVILPSNISGINFGSTNLTGADFSNVTNMANTQIGDGYNPMDLSGADFSNVTNWSGAYFYGPTWPSAGLKLIRLKLPNSSAGRARFEGCDFSPLSLGIGGEGFAEDWPRNAGSYYIALEDYYGVNNLHFSSCNFDACEIGISGACDFDGCYIRGGTISSTDWSLVNKNNGDYNVGFQSCRIDGVNLMGSLENADFSNAYIENYYVRLNDGRSVNSRVQMFSQSGQRQLPYVVYDLALYAPANMLRNAKLNTVDLTWTKLPPNLSGTSFNNCILENTTDFSAVTSLENTYFNGIYTLGEGSRLPSNVNFNNVTNADGINFYGVAYTGLIADTYFVTQYLNYGDSATATTLDSTGSGWWATGGWDQSGRYYVNGQETTIPESGTGWDSNSSVYYIGGVATTLDSNGTGWDSNSFVYYLSGVATGLDSNGDGFWNEVPYYNGYVFTQGYLPTNGIYYIGGQATDLNSAGEGYWNGSWYINGYIPDSTFTGCGFEGGTWGYFHNGNYLGGEVDCEGRGLDNQYYYQYVIQGQPTDLSRGGNGYFNGILYIGGYPNPTYTGVAYLDGGFEAYYVNGQPTELDQSGNGTSGGLYYVSGVLFSGYEENSGIYYVGGQATELDSTGNGTYNGQTYINGVVQGGGGDNGGGGGNSSSVVIQGNAKFYGNVKFGV